MPRHSEKVSKRTAAAASRTTKAVNSDKAVRKPAGKSTRAKSRAKGASASRQKTSVYLDPDQRRHLERLTRRTGRPQAQLIREAIESYEPPTGGDRNFALAGGFRRIDSDPRPISQISEEELMRGFGE
jgi:hypothetical protein